jgi:hypothetical protein
MVPLISNPFKVKGLEVEMDLLAEPIESLKIRFTFVKSVLELWLEILREEAIVEIFDELSADFI